MTRTSPTIAMLLGALALVAFVIIGTATAVPLERAFHTLGTASRVADAARNHIERMTPAESGGVSATPAPVASPGGDDAAGGTNAGSKTDFEGDEVSPALATYGIDRDGNLFEVHSPHTEVPRLPGPTL